jgi:fructose 1,6-bisphosphate aldolase/phosphatase
MAKKVTVSVIKADIGGFVGHSSVHPSLMENAEKMLAPVKKKGFLTDFRVLHCGDDLELIMTHFHGVGNKMVHKLAWDIFKSGTEIAKKLKLYGAGQDLLVDAFSGNVKGMGPGVAEMEFVERKSEPIVVFMADKTSPGAWNMPLYKMFADPFGTAGLVIDLSMHGGFEFDVLDLKKDVSVRLRTPDELYDLLVFIGAPDAYVIKDIYRRSDGEIGATSSTTRLSLIAGKYVGKDDPVCVVRSQSGFPALGEVIDPFAFPHLVPGWMRGSHIGPLMPVSFKDAHPARFDGPPRVIAAGFQLAEGKLIGPQDLFDDPSFDRARQICNEIADYMRRHGPFEPHRLPLDEMEYTTMAEVMRKLRPRFKKSK